MNHKEVIKCLCEDMEKTELPPISEKVLQALSEQRQKYIEYIKKEETLNKQKNDRFKKYVFAAMLALLAVSVPIVVVMKKQSPAADLTNSAVLSDSSKTVSISESQVISNAESQTTLEHIKLKQSYGEVALSGKSEKELEHLLVTYSKENKVYEDDKYIYNFNSQGRLIEMRKAAFGDEDGQPADEQTISAKVNALLKEYYPDWLESECDIRIEKNEDGYPAWTVYGIKTIDHFTKEIVYITFEKTGTLKAIISCGSAENVGVISKEDAVKIAIKELKSGKYDIIDFNAEDVDIMTDVKKRDNEDYYSILINNIRTDKNILEEFYFENFYFEINANTGEIKYIDIGY